MGTSGRVGELVRENVEVVREGRLARAQMFYFDTAALAGFLARAGRREHGR